MDKIGICSYFSIAILSIAGYAILGLGFGTYFLIMNYYQGACANNDSRDLLNGISYAIFGMSYLFGSLFS